MSDAIRITDATRITDAIGIAVSIFSEWFLVVSASI